MVTENETNEEVMKSSEGGETEEEKPSCPVALKPMADWVAEEDSKVCRPCLVGPVASWYAQELEERGMKEEAEALNRFADDNSEDLPLTVCKELDKIKDTVEGPLRRRLEEFDCHAQTFNPDEEIKEDDKA